MGEPVALEQLDAQVTHQLVLRRRFDLFGHQRGLAVGSGKFDQGGCQLGLEGLHVQLEEGRQGQPAGVGALEGLLVKREAKAACAQCFQRGQAAFDFFLGGAIGQGRDFQHHLFGVDQLQVAAREAVVRAIDEHRLLADQRFGAGV